VKALFNLRPVICIFACLLLTGCLSSDPKNSTDGEELYSFHCQKCHKKDGSGDPIAGFPANKRTQLQEQQVIMLIRQGDPSRPDMPVFSDLSEQQAAAIVDYLFSLKLQ